VKQEFVLLLIIRPKWATFPEEKPPASGSGGNSKRYQVLDTLNA
jgi:hypothetical protein